MHASRSIARLPSADTALHESFRKQSDRNQEIDNATDRLAVEQGGDSQNQDAHAERDPDPTPTATRHQPLEKRAYPIYNHLRRIGCPGDIRERSYKPWLTLDL
jgi:hypothetical protein